MRRESRAGDTAEEPESIAIPEVIFPAGNPDFRALRNRCARACRAFNSTPEDADPEERSQKWLDIVRPDRDRTEDGIAVTHDQTFANPALKAKTPFVKPPVFVDYGIRLHVGGSTFINRGCMIMDTPVADVVIGEGCNIGPNCCIVGVTHLVRLDERLLRHSIGQPVTIGNDVWIGANVTILGGVTIGDGAVIGACSLVNRDIPPMTVAYGVPARVVEHLDNVKPTVFADMVTTGTVGEALALPNRLPTRRYRVGSGGKALNGKMKEAGAEEVVVEEEEEEEEEEQEEEGSGGGGGGGGGGGVDIRGYAGSGEEGRGGFAAGRGLGLRRRPRECLVGSESSVTVLSEAHRSVGAAELKGLSTAPSPPRAPAPASLASSSSSSSSSSSLLFLRRGSRRQQQQQRRLQWLEVKVLVAAAVAAALFILFFLAGVYLGANKSWLVE